MKKTILFPAFVYLIISCSSPLNKKFSEEKAEKDMLEIKEKLDSTELMLLAGTMIRLKLQDKELEGMTYQEILDDGKKWKTEQDKIEKEQKKLAKKVKNEEEERIRILSESVIVTCYKKGFSKYNYEDYITYKFAIQNKSDKEIRAVKGQIEFTNLFGDKIKSLSFVYDQAIQANSEATWNASTDYNQFNDGDQALKNKDLKDIKVIWKPEKIIFSDGSTIE
ncbi:hypothetical protein [Aquimarina pacifica]|uniref:hypothetical protein n=1 Tax=Aquimarina pacifica TaxID=1296415 RepID=UPI00046E7CEF|nr:hypothetical protein [Aquimarina pacifica]